MKGFGLETVAKKWSAGNQLVCAPERLRTAMTMERGAGPSQRSVPISALVLTRKITNLLRELSYCR